MTLWSIQRALAPALAPGVLPALLCRHAQDKDRIWVGLVFVPESRIEADVGWNRTGGRPDVQLIFGLYGGSVEFGSLTGNGFDAPGFHRLGFGTFVVNIAVQALKAALPHTRIVHGVLSNTAEADLAEPDRLRHEADRRAFWRRFGLEVVSRGDPPIDYLQGSVGRLSIVPTGMLGGQFARGISRKDFVKQRPAGF